MTTSCRQIAAPHPGTGRNQPCPCGSGRKFKSCCLRRPNRSPRLLGALIDLRLHLFVEDQPDEPVVVTTTVAAFARHRSRHDPAAPPTAPTVADLVAFEGGLARTYLAQRGALLPADEHAILEAAVDEPRRLWDVVDVIAGSAIVVHDPDTGRKAEVDDPIASRPASIGSTLLWRIARVGDVDYSLGYQIEVPPAENAALRAILQDDPTALGLAAWYWPAPATGG